jgi:protein subunit release factor A
MLADPQVHERADQFRELSVEYARLLPTATALRDYRRLEADLESAEALRTDADPGMRAMGEEEAARLRTELAASEEALQRLLLPQDPHDEGNIFLEIRAGTGGDEAAIFAGDLLRMYARYAERRAWQVELISESGGEHGGYREVICRVVGRGAFSRLKFESGAHRVQRVPATEAQGRIHTSACTVAILPELATIDRIDINPADLRIAHRVQAVSTSIRPTRPFASLIYLRASLWNARMNARSTRIVRARCRSCKRACWPQNRRNAPAPRPRLASSRWAAATVRSESGPIIFRRVDSLTIASI